MSRARIIATVGPASLEPSVMQELIRSGVNIFRVNCSHGDSEENARHVEFVRQQIEESGKLVGILADLAGPKIRVGKVDMELENGSNVTFRAGCDEADDGAIPVPYDGLASDVEPGDSILLSDGMLVTKVVSVDPPEITAAVIEGGRLTPHKGLNLPGAGLKLHAPTEKDLVDLPGVLNAGADFIGLSFVRSADDVERMRRAIRSHGFDRPIVSKFERPEVIDHLDELTEASDAVMVARGDLGIETEPGNVPVLQKRIIRVALEHSKPVIVATQMLESMVEHPMPTRAETSDIANAILDGCDAVMLSEETAIGKYPVQAVRRMANIVELTERAWFGERERKTYSERQRYRALSRAAASLVRDLGAAAIVVSTETGESVKTVAADRQEVPVLAFSRSEETLRRLVLINDVTAALGHQSDASLSEAAALALRDGIASPGDLLVCIVSREGSPARADRIVLHEV